jgi:glycosyltransferase involved in cell wall biosynthesis
MRILIATVHVPFIRGGAEHLAEGLRDALAAEGHQAEILAIPFKWYPPERIVDHILACRLFDPTESAGVPVDRVIGLKFPAYFVPHPNKVLWLLHQHRPAYELWNHNLGDLIKAPNGAQVRDIIREADNQLLPEAKAVYTISQNVSGRLKKYCHKDSLPLYHPPPGAGQFYAAKKAEDFFFFPSRLGPLKRQELVLLALARTRYPVRVVFAGEADHPPYREEMAHLARSLGLYRRVEWLGLVTDAQKHDLYARCQGVIFPPIDEDYGYITLEAMLSSKAVVTCADSGGPLEFVVPDGTGLVVEPTPDGLASALDRLWKEKELAKFLGARGREHYDALNISWREVVRRLAA